MKFVLDRMCIQTSLCKTCQKLIDEGMASQMDIDLGLIIMNLGKSNKYLNDLHVLRIITTEKNIFVIVKKGQVDKLKKAHDLIKERLKDSRNLIVLEKTKSAKTLVEKLLAPIPVVGNSTIMLPFGEGEQELKIKINQRDKNDKLLAVEETSKLTKALLGMNAHYVFV